MKQYRIPFSGLKIGTHVFEYDVDGRFFDCFDYSLVKSGDLKVTATLQKQENMMVVDFYIDGRIDLNCDVCLSDFPAKVSAKDRLIVKFTDEDINEITEDVVVLSKGEYELDIADRLYECINLAVPHYKKCSEQGENIQCDDQMIQRLSELAPDQEQEKDVDPRWEALTRFKGNN